jgi:hypothetical protein
VSDLTQVRLALDPLFFAKRALELDALDDWQVSFLRSTDQRVLCNVHRQGGKSSMTAVLALRQALYYPGSLVLILAPSLRQGLEFFGKVSSCYKRLHGEGLSVLAESDRKLGLVLENGSRIEVLPGGSESTVRGFSAPDLVIVDEASRISDDLFVAILPMLTASRDGGRLLLLSTPAGKRGVFWRLWSNQDGSGDGWVRIEVPATAVDRISPAAIEEARRTLLDWEFSQEMLCSFEANSTSVFDPQALEDALDDSFEPLFPVDDEAV